MTRSTARYYLHNLDGLKQDIADINADLEQYRAMTTPVFYTDGAKESQVDKDQDPYKDAPDPSIILPKGHIKAYSNTQVNFTPGHYSDNSPVESLAIHRADFIIRLEQELFDKKSILAAINCVLYYLDGYDRQLDKQIIQLRYREHLPWSIVARKINYARETTLDRDKRIIDEIISNYNARTK
jgi:hypothetical protein